MNANARKEMYIKKSDESPYPNDKSADGMALVKSFSQLTVDSFASTGRKAKGTTTVVVHHLNNI